MLKEFLTNTRMNWARNVEGKNAEGLMVRKTEKGEVTTQLWFAGNMNRTFHMVNTGMKRRFEPQLCVKLERADGYTMEDSKRREKTVSSTDGNPREKIEMEHILEAFHDNASIHMILGHAR